MTPYRQTKPRKPLPPAKVIAWKTYLQANERTKLRAHCVKLADSVALCGARCRWSSVPPAEDLIRCGRCTERLHGTFNPRLGTGKRSPGLHRTLHILFDMIQESGLSEQEVARRAGLQHSTLADWRRGRRWPLFFMLETVFNTLGAKLAVTVDGKVQRRLSKTVGEQDDSRREEDE